ncbi:MAG: glycosyltransferase [Candidatus Moranbacteria bacterium]|nr:glycosyltransferase [Candidatus Moranbacteria bacterium]
MNLFLIKIGKAFTAIRRDGILVGGRRVLNYFATFLKTISTFKSGDVLFITGGVGDSAKYRAYKVAEELNFHGIKAEVMIQDNPFLALFASKFKVFVFHRTLVTPTVKKLLERVKKQGKEIIFETDDLVFDTKYMHATDMYKKMSFFEKKQYAKGVGEEILRDDYVKVCTTTTTYLAKVLESYGKKVFIVPNKLTEYDVTVAENIHKNQKPKTKNQKKIRIGYFSGTMSHNKDFATITEALMIIMEKYPQVRLVLVGPLEVENALNKFQDRIEQFPLAPWEKHLENISKVDINLAPLEPGDPFCEAKSELKFFEAGILGVPTVAVANQTFSEAIADGIDGYVAKTTAEWVEKLEKLVVDANLREEIGKKAQEKTIEKYTNKNSHNEEYYNYLRSKL